MIVTELQGTFKFFVSFHYNIVNIKFRNAESQSDHDPHFANSYPCHHKQILTTICMVVPFHSKFSPLQLAFMVLFISLQLEMPPSSIVWHCSLTCQPPFPSTSWNSVVGYCLMLLINILPPVCLVSCHHLPCLSHSSPPCTVFVPMQLNRCHVLSFNVVYLILLVLLVSHLGSKYFFAVPNWPWWACHKTTVTSSNCKRS
jgi:hypothetical protein